MGQGIKFCQGYADCMTQRLSYLRQQVTILEIQSND